jgi:hypothetical protein
VTFLPRLRACLRALLLVHHHVQIDRGRNVHAAGTLSIDRWNGEEHVQFRIMDLAEAEPGAR